MCAKSGRFLSGYPRAPTNSSDSHSLSMFSPSCAADLAHNLSIDVEQGVDEQKSATLLEKCCDSLRPKVAVFSVVSNCFVALEMTEHTKFDLIIIQRGLPQLDILAVLKVLRAIGNYTPIVCMERAPKGSNKQSLQTRLTSAARTIGYAYALIQPYSANSLCDCIKEAIRYGTEQATIETSKRVAAEFNSQLNSKDLDVKKVLDSSESNLTLKTNMAKTVPMKAAREEPLAKSAIGSVGMMKKKSRAAKSDTSALKASVNAPEDDKPMANMRRSGRNGGFRVRGNIFDEIEKLNPGGIKAGDDGTRQAAGFLAQLSGLAAQRAAASSVKKASQTEAEAADWLSTLSAQGPGSSSGS